MPSVQESTLLPPPPPQSSPWPRLPPVQTEQSAPESGRIIFTRQLWQRTMPDGNQSEPSVLNRSHTQDTPVIHNIAAGPNRRTSSASSRSHRLSPNPSHGSSKTPLTPEESPPFRTTRKRTTGIVEQEDKDLDNIHDSPAHSRANSGDSIHVCICQPDPKIPRPRNGMGCYSYVVVDGI
jgi:HMG box factor